MAARLLRCVLVSMLTCTTAQAGGWKSGARAYEKAAAECRRSGAPLIVLVEGDKCDGCRKLNRDVLKKSAVKKRLGKLTKVRINPDRNVKDRAIAEKLGADGTPTFFVLAPQGGQSARVPNTEPLEPTKWLESFEDAMASIQSSDDGDGTGEQTLEVQEELPSGPLKGEALFERGVELAKRKKHKEAIRDFKQLIWDTPSHKRAREEMAMSYMALKKLKPAIKLLSEILESDPQYGNGRIWHLRGQLYQRTGKKTQARRDYEEACNRGTAAACK